MDKGQPKEKINVLSLSSNFDTSIIEKVSVDLSSLNLNHTSKNPAFILRNVLTANECASLIEISESGGFSKALVNYGGTDILNENARNSSRYILDDELFTSTLWDRIKSFIPVKLKAAKVIGLNERLRFLRYNPGEWFAPHSDGTYARDHLELSLITLQMYLNDGFEGGETTFLGDDTSEAVQTEGNEMNIQEQKKKVSVVPQTGMILVFEQDLMHEGSLLKSGVKYTIRTDVMYSYA